ncbi:MAG: glycine--tRNA ligase subunit beta [Hydrogenothermaceae bacterium]|nr:glycine--tRNA ligase subunit beta [Hydrogenothermaceae bacterium]
MAEYLLEIGCEELPPRASNILREHFYNFFTERFSSFFSFQTPDNVRVFSTPRRVAVYLKNLKEREEPKQILIVGPPYKLAIDQDGKFTKAAISFAQKNSIPLEKLQKIENEKGQYIGAYIEREGERLESFIKDAVLEVFENLPSLKSMRWNDTVFRFPRPIRWILSLLDSKVIELEIGGVRASNYTYLHRFMTNPIGRGERKEIAHPSLYEETLKLGFVIPSYEERRRSIETQLAGFGKTVSGEPVLDPELIDEVVNLTEFPVGILGDFSPEYLTMPDEVIVTVCKHHQRYFNFKRDGKLIPKFLAISNNAVKDREVVKIGYEKVLKARLEDALFFYKEDLKKRLDDHIQKLKTIQFHEKLGSVYEKVERNLELSKLLASLIQYDQLEKVERACWLSKTDLLTEMVKEFDELQGVIGRHYALKQGEDEEVSQAIFEHYLPRTAEDSLPETKLGTILSLADKIDTVVSFISIGELPKASADPFAIRRNAIGIVRILIGKSIHLDLSEIIKNTYVIGFLALRVESFLHSEGYPLDIVKAVLAVENSNPYSIYKKVQSLVKLKELQDYERVITVFKRVVNIVPEGFQANVDPELFEKEEEVRLFKEINSLKSVFDRAVQMKDFDLAINYLLQLKPYIDAFFDNVMVMVEDERLKRNRLSLLSTISSMFGKIADFTKIIGG